jgi:hypothetical protein
MKEPELCPVPLREPEIILAEANRRYYGDTERVATTTLRRSLTVCGVYISSRYVKADELEAMRAMVLELPAQLRAEVAEVWCDSKASHCYTVTVRRWSVAKTIAHRMDAAAWAVRGGHNGIDLVLSGSGEHQLTVDPEWHEVWDDDLTCWAP